MARTRDRIIALVIAVAFFATSFAVSFLVILQLIKDNKEAKIVDQSSNSAAADAQQSKPLKGTQLAGFTPVAKIEKLERQEIQAGTGAEVPKGASLTVDYTGAVAATGVVFESSLDGGQPASFSLDGVIKGWTDGIPGAKVGGKYRLLIPAEQAYGATPRDGSGIPPNADLVFDITIHSIGQ
jgi:FKBP-type peptidyl-prolyl cis-trans isomerase